MPEVPSQKPLTVRLTFDSFPRYGLDEGGGLALILVWLGLAGVLTLFWKASSSER